MEKSISTPPLQDLGRYLQSLDSVRFAESDVIACTIQARAEMLVSLLFGQTIPIGEHQFLDSDGFINSAVDLINSIKNLDRKDRPKVTRIFPFRVGIRAAYGTVDNLIAVKLGDVNYKLSRWQSLGKMNDIRMEIKKKHEKGKFKFKDLYKIIPTDELGAVEELKLIRDRFVGGEKGEILTFYNQPTVVSAPFIGLLRRGLDELISWDESNLYKQIEEEQDLVMQGFEIKNALDRDLVTPALELIEALKALHKEGVSFDNRSDVRKNPKFRQVIHDDNKFDGILEIYDSLYNSSVAHAVGSHSEGVSSARNIQDNLYIKAALELSALVINQVTSVRSERAASKKLLTTREFQWVHDTNFDVIKDTKEQLVLSKMPWEVVWNAYLNDDWRKSLSNLNEAYFEWDKFIQQGTDDANKFYEQEQQLSETIHKHTDNMQKLLSGSIMQLHKNSKTEEIVFDIAGVAGPLITGAQLIMSKLGFMADLTTSALADVVSLVAVGTKHTLPSIKAWRTSGQIRKMFKRIFDPKP